MAVNNPSIVIQNNKATATGSTTITTGTDALVASMTLTPVAGTYLVMFSTTITGNSNNANTFISVYAGGVQVASSEVSGTPQIQGGITPSLNMNVPINTQATVTVNGSQAIEIRGRRTAGTTTVLSRSLIILRIG